MPKVSRRDASEGVRESSANCGCGGLISVRTGADAFRAVGSAARGADGGITGSGPSECGMSAKANAHRRFNSPSSCSVNDWRSIRGDLGM